MRLLVFFDLPVTTQKNRREYAAFRKLLIKSGFLMEQESVYSKLVTNPAAADAVSDFLKDNKPPEGVVQILKVTEKQYAKMEFIVGKKCTDILNDDRKLVIL